MVLGRGFGVLVQRIGDCCGIAVNKLALDLLPAALAVGYKLFEVQGFSDSLDGGDDASARVHRHIEVGALATSQTGKSRRSAAIETTL